MGIGNFLYVIDAAMVMICIWVFTKRNRDLKFIKPSISVLLIVVGVSFGIAQLLMFAPMLNLVIATLCIVLYLYQQSPDAADYSELLEVITYSMESAKQIRKGAINFARELDLKWLHETRQIEKAVSGESFAELIRTML